MRRVNDQIRTNTWAKYTYINPATVLPRLWDLQADPRILHLPEKTRTLRKGNQKIHRESRQAALFCYGVSQAFLGHPILFAPEENEDFDFVARWIDRDENDNYCPVQLKELVPEHLNEDAALDELLGKLSRYCGPKDTVFAIYLNRRTRIELDKVEVPQIRAGGLWMFGGITPDQREWMVAGDFLQTPEIRTFEYPTD